MSAFFSKLLAILLSKIVKNAIFELGCEILILEVLLCFNLVQKCCFAIVELRYASTESKNFLRKLRCFQKLKIIKLRFFAAPLQIGKIVALFCVALLK